MKVLVAEDSSVLRKVLHKHLRSWGYDPVMVEDGDKAWEILQSDDTPRLAILDWQMPGMDGIELCRKVKKSDDMPFIYIVMLTNRDEQEDMIAGIDAGADDYLTKPVKPAVLRSRMLAARRIVQAIPPKEWTVPRIEGYDVKKMLGKGAFATVWEAVHLASGDRHALKIIRTDLATDEALGGFIREIRLMQKMDHPNIALVYDSHWDKSMGYCAMEFVDGWTLDKYVKEEKPNEARLVYLVSKVAGALDHAHKQGVVHRDLKPTNILVTRDAQPKLVDFGFGKSLFLSDVAGESGDGIVVGTPLAMSPEQARGENNKIDGRTDIYALGIALYLLLLRRHPHEIGKDRRQARKQIAEGEVRPPSKLDPNFDPDLEKILLRALAKEPEDRYQTAGEFEADLRNYARTRFKQ